MTTLRQRLLARQKSLQAIRNYFAKNNVTEVDTALLAEFSVTDPYMNAMQVIATDGKSLGYLQTSPEYAMKKLLCAGSGDIFQLGKVFRCEEISPQHCPEFTMLEWYRQGFSLAELMDEVFTIVQMVSGLSQRVNLTYRDAFQQFLQIDPFDISFDELADFATQRLGELPSEMLFDNYLSLLFTTQIETRFDPAKVTFVNDFPASQASLAITREAAYGKVAQRFEAYSGGLELANGFYELADADEQLMRFQQDNDIRNRLNYPNIAIDHQLINSLKLGLPDCCGVAVGVDRLLMLQLGCDNIQQVLPLVDK